MLQRACVYSPTICHLVETNEKQDVLRLIYGVKRQFAVAAFLNSVLPEGAVRTHLLSAADPEILWVSEYVTLGPAVGMHVWPANTFSAGMPYCSRLDMWVSCRDGLFEPVCLHRMPIFRPDWDNVDRRARIATNGLTETEKDYLQKDIAVLQRKHDTGWVL